MDKLNSDKLNAAMYHNSNFNIQTISWDWAKCSVQVLYNRSNLFDCLLQPQISSGAEGEKESILLIIEDNTIYKAKLSPFGF